MKTARTFPLPIIVTTGRQTVLIEEIWQCNTLEQRNAVLRYRHSRTKMCVHSSPSMKTPILPPNALSHIYLSKQRGKTLATQSSSSQSSYHLWCVLDWGTSTLLYNLSSCCNWALTLLPIRGLASSCSSPSFQLCTVHVPCEVPHPFQDVAALR